MDDLIEELRRRKARALEMGGVEKIKKQHARGSLTARERVDMLLDPGSFVEVGILNHSDIQGMEEKTPADAKVCGFGKIDGRTAAISADDVTVLAGSGGRVGMDKVLRVSETAKKQGFPFINLGDAGGSRIPDIQGSDGLSGMTFQAEMGRRRRVVPMAATIMGDCFGSPAWHASLADFVVQVKGSCMAVSGPRVLEMATGERVNMEELGGWKLHSEITGQVDRVAEDDAECLSLVREFLSYLPSNAEELAPRLVSDDDPLPRQAGLCGLVPREANRGYDMMRLARTIFDNEKLFALKPDFDRSVITALARLNGDSVGVIANNPSKLSGAMGPEGSDKCCAFICLCDSFNIPLIFLHDTPGFRVGKDAEVKRMPGKIINFIEAISLATVPKLSLVIRKSYGMAYSNMCGPGMGANFEFAWPGADISFMAPEIAANVVHQRKISASPDPQATRAAAVQEMRLASAPWRAAGLGYLDDIIEPADSRKVLIQALDLARSHRRGGLSERLLAAWPTTF